MFVDDQVVIDHVVIDKISSPQITERETGIMPTNLFFEIDEQKQKMILDASLTEFSSRGYAAGSTNQIALATGISKGSLFTYFNTKEDLYMYLLDGVIREFLSAMSDYEAELPKELFQRVIKYAERELSWHLDHPRESMLIVQAFSMNSSEIRKKIEAKYGAEEQNIYFSLMECVDMTHLKGDRQVILNIIKWTLNGLQDSVTGRMTVGKDIVIKDLFEEYQNNLILYMDTLKAALT